MIDHAAPDWDRIRQRYEETQDSVAQICRDAGIDERALAGRRKKEKWRRAHPRPFPPLRKAGPLHATPPAEPAGTPADTSAETAVEPEPEPAIEPPLPVLPPIPRRLLATPTGRRRLVERLTTAIALKLEQLERRMSKDLSVGDDITSTDHERETRTIGALIDNLEKIRELEAGLGKTTGKLRADTATPGLADEADRCRRELAERLARLVEASGRPA